MKDDTKKTKDSLLKSVKVLEKQLADAVDLLDEYRLSIGYLNFDVEATRRERDYWRKKAGSK